MLLLEENPNVQKEGNIEVTDKDIVHILLGKDSDNVKVTKRKLEELLKSSNLKLDQMDLECYLKSF